MTASPPRILLGQLAAFGDCLYATVIARQIKHDYPGCHLTWAIAAPFRQIINGNPHVDAIWEIPMSRAEAVSSGWRSFVADAKARRRRGDFDVLFFTQVPPDNYQNFDGTVRASILNGYPHPITVPLTPVLRLTTEDVEHVRQFAERHALSQYRHVILFECAGLSGQTFVTKLFALETARLLLEERQDCCFILSSSEPVISHDPRIVDGSVLSFRENAELTKHATLFVGCSSGITWITTSDWAKPLPTIQLLRKATSIYASMVHDAEHFGLPHGHIIEMTDCPPDHLVECIRNVLTGSFEDARAKFHERIPLNHQFYFSTFFIPILKRGQFGKAFSSLGHVIRRYGARAIIDTIQATFDEL
jgi:hypothetical protein